MSISKETPDFQDTVQHKITGISGTVDACYTKDGIAYIDVVDGNDMYYETLASKWEVVSKYIE